MPSLLDETYLRYKRELNSHREAIKAIEFKMAALREAGAEDLDGTAPGQMSFGGNVSGPPIISVNTRRRGDLTETVHRAVSLAGKRVGTGEVKAALLAQGYKPKSKNFTTTLFKTLRRLGEKGRIGREMVNGEWSYFPL